MITNIMREEYMAPEAVPVMVSSEAMVCTSPTDILGERQDYGDPINLFW